MDETGEVMKTIRIRRPDDFHLHIRDGEMMQLVLPCTTEVFRRAIIMPNLRLTGQQKDPKRDPPPVRTYVDVLGYLGRIRFNVGRSRPFEPLMTIALTDETTPGTIMMASSYITAVKVYPLGATTNSGWGISDFDAENFHACLNTLSNRGIPLLIHPEVPHGFSMTREQRFLEILSRIIDRHPTLKIVVEHVTDRRTVQFVKDAPETVAATITAHHLYLTHDDVMGTRIHPHLFCLPTAKLEEDRDALCEAVLSSDPKFFFGSDSAPHEIRTKQCADGCAGCFTAPVALPLLAQFFGEHGKLHLLEAFVSEFGAAFYGLPPNDETIELVNEPWTIPEHYTTVELGVVPFMAGQTLSWRIAQT